MLPTIAIAAIGLFFLWFVVSAVRYSMKAGPVRLDERELARARSIRRLEAGGEDSWDALGSMTEARGLDLRFDHDDDPEARAWLLLPGAPAEKPGSLGSQGITVTLTPDFQTHHVHSTGFVLRAELRGTEGSVGKEVELRMWHAPGPEPYGASIQNDDDNDCPVGAWIEVRSVELLEVFRG